MIRERKGGTSYLSASGSGLHFGLGSASRVERITIRWPSGKETLLSDVPADQWLTIREK